MEQSKGKVGDCKSYACGMDWDKWSKDYDKEIHKSEFWKVLPSIKSKYE